MNQPRSPVFDLGTPHEVLTVGEGRTIWTPRPVPLRSRYRGRCGRIARTARRGASPVCLGIGVFDPGVQPCSVPQSAPVASSVTSGPRVGERGSTSRLPILVFVISGPFTRPGERGRQAEATQRGCQQGDTFNRVFRVRSATAFKGVHRQRQMSAPLMIYARCSCQLVGASSTTACSYDQMTLTAIPRPSSAGGGDPLSGP